MFSCTAAQMRDFDRLTISRTGTPGLTLMRRAGRQVAVAAAELIRQGSLEQVTVLAGKGHNGGDALIAAAEILRHGYPVRLHLCARPDELSGDTAAAAAELPDTLRTTLDQPPGPESLTPRTLVLDGLLGTGSHGEPREPLATWIRLLQASGCPVLAIDIPSGLQADSGEAGLCVTADLTVTFALPKTGMLTGAGPQLCGRIKIADIGFPPELQQGPAEGIACFSQREAAALFCREDFATFKNRRGRVTVIGGSMLYGHAPFLSAEAALRAGAGLAAVLIPQHSNPLCSIARALIVRRLPDAGCGFLGREALPHIATETAASQAVACGPGLGHQPESLPILEFLLQADVPLVLDADALNLLAARPALLPARRTAPVLLTPHPGEMRRLQQAFNLNPEESPVEQARRLAAATGCHVILKGCRSISAAPDGTYFVNLSGAPSLATAGSGDVLTGIAAALLANRTPPLLAAAGAAFLHGVAGEILAPLGSRGAIADDLLTAIPAALRHISPLA